MNLRPFSLYCSLLVGVCLLTAVATAQDQTINGNLFVNSTLDVNGNTASFGTNGLSPGYNLIYTNGTLATVDFSASSSTVNWTWYQGNTNPQLRLDSTNKLNLFSTTNATTPQIVLNPAGTSTFALGLTVNGTFAITGPFNTSGSFTAWGGAITGGSSGLTINAGGSNKNITLTPSGTGSTVTARPLRVNNTTTSTSSTTGALTVAGGVGVTGKLNVAGDVSIGTSASTARLTVAGAGTTAAASVVNFTDSANQPLLFVRNDGNVGIGTSSPSDKLAVNGTISATGVISSKTALRTPPGGDLLMGSFLAGTNPAMP